MQQAYLIAQFRRAKGDRDPKACVLIGTDLSSEADPACTLIGVDLFSEANLSIVSRFSFFLLVVTRGVGHSFEEACRDAIRLCAADPCLTWMLSYLAPRSQHYARWTGEHACRRCGRDRPDVELPTPFERIAGWKGRLCPICRSVNPDGGD